MQVGDALGIDLGAVGRQVLTREQVLRQYPHTAPHLQHIGRGFGGSARKGAGDFTGDIQIDEEMLPQRLLCFYLLHTPQR